MDWSLLFFVNSALLGVGLAMDAFSISVAGGLQCPDMPLGESATRSGVFGFFQFAMPMVGWLCVHTIAERFSAFQKWIPWIALALLGYIGGRMLWEGIHPGKAETEEAEEAARSEKAGGGIAWGVLLAQGVATSIDALSVGFTIADYAPLMATVCSLVIAVVTFAVCMAGFRLGKSVGSRLGGKAEILGGAILLFIGLEIWVKGVF